MRILLVGSGSVTAQLAVSLQQRGHSVVAQLPFIQEEILSGFDVDVALIIAPEARVDSTQANAILTKGTPVVVIAAAGAPLVAWAEGVGAPAFTYPPSSADIPDILSAVEQTVQADDREQAQRYVRETLGGDWAARVQGVLATRRIAITSPKGGVGKTTIAANLAVLFGLTGLTVYAVDADTNAGALYHHLKSYSTKGSLLAALHQFDQIRQQRHTGMANVPLGALILDKFVTVPGLPTVHLLPGVKSDQAGDAILNDEELVAQAISALYDIGVHQGGVTIMDVGINPAIPLHRAAIANADTVVILLKPELPDADQVHVWLRNMVTTITQELKTPDSGLEYLSQRVRLVFNQVVDNQHVEDMITLLRNILKEQGVPVLPPIAARIPMVPPDTAAKAVNSPDPEKIFILDYVKNGTPELSPFVSSLLSLGTQLIPVVAEGAERIGLFKQRRKKRWRFW